MTSPERSSSPKRSKSRSRSRSPPPQTQSKNSPPVPNDKIPAPSIESITEQVDKVDIQNDDNPDEPSPAVVVSEHVDTAQVTSDGNPAEPKVVPEHVQNTETISHAKPDEQDVHPELADSITKNGKSSELDPVVVPFGGLYEDDITGDEIQITLMSGVKTKVVSAKKFEDLNFPDVILKGIYEAGFNTPSIIQAKALPLLLADPPANMIAQSRSGTGKTAAFALTMIYRCDPSLRVPQAICLVNTRELALQIVNVIKSLGKYAGLSVGIGIPQGVSRGQRVTDQIVVGTPGTMLDLCRRRQLSMDRVQMLVLDEADAMLDTQNLLAQSAEVRKLANHNPQVLLFSATFPDKVKNFATTFAPRANILMLPREEVNVKAIHQFFVHVNGPQAKFEKLSDLYALLSVGQSIIFVQRRADAYMLRDRLYHDGHAATVITGEDTPQDRDRTMAEFRSGTSKVLIATNVLARGIDVPQINLVVNYDMPIDRVGNPDHEAYMHRIGRTGRFGRQGVSVNFIDGPGARDIQNLVIRQYSLDIKEMPDDFDEMEKMLKGCRV